MAISVPCATDITPFNVFAIPKEIRARLNALSICTLLDVSRLWVKFNVIAAINSSAIDNLIDSLF